MPPIITIDASDVTHLATSLRIISLIAPEMLQQGLDQATRARVSELRRLAPSQTRKDLRYLTKLKNSFYWQRAGNTRLIGTKTLDKYLWVTQGTRAHMIYPRHPKEALWWPGLSNPVAYVHHPGTQPNHFEEEARRNYDMHGGDQLVLQTISDLIVSGVSTTLVALSGITSMMLTPIAALFQWAANEKED